MKLSKKYIALSTGDTVPRKIRQLKKQLKDLGFTSRSGKGSHQVWNHPLLVEPIVIARKDGDDLPFAYSLKLTVY